MRSRISARQVVSVSFLVDLLDVVTNLVVMLLTGPLRKCLPLLRECQVVSTPWRRPSLYGVLATIMPSDDFGGLRAITRPVKGVGALVFFPSFQ